MIARRAEVPDPNRTRTHDIWIRTALELGESANGNALSDAGLSLRDVDAIFFSTVIGIASPSLDARLVNKMGFRADVRRTPIFGLGCAADYLRGHPDHVAVVLTVELCSLRPSRRTIGRSRT